MTVTEGRTAVSGDAAQLPILNRFLQEFWSAANLPPAQALHFELALEEVFMNIVVHGRGRTAAVAVSLALGANGLTMTVEDDGPQFDPLQLPPPDLEARLAQRPIGGLGVFLVRQVMDTVSYQRAGALNRLTMTKSLAG